MYLKFSKHPNGVRIKVPRDKFYSIMLSGNIDLASIPVGEAEKGVFEISPTLALFTGHGLNNLTIKFIVL